MVSEYRALSALPELPVIRRVLIDSHTVSDSSTIGEAEIETATGLLTAQLRVLLNMNIAIYADHTIGKAKKAEAAMSRPGLPIVIFNRLDTACTFLGIQMEVARQQVEELRFQLREREYQF